MCSVLMGNSGAVSSIAPKINSRVRNVPNGRGNGDYCQIAISALLVYCLPLSASFFMPQCKTVDESLLFFFIEIGRILGRITSSFPLIG